MALGVSAAMPRTANVFMITPATPFACPKEYPVLDRRGAFRKARVKPPSRIAISAGPAAVRLIIVRQTIAFVLSDRPGRDADASVHAVCRRAGPLAWIQRSRCVRTSRRGVYPCYGARRASAPRPATFAKPLNEAGADPSES